MSLVARVGLLLAFVTAPFVATATADEAANEALARRFYEAMNTGNVGAFDQFVANDLIDHTPTVPDAPQGLAGVKHEIQGYITAFPDLKVVNDKVIAKDDYVTVISTVMGTNTGPLQDMAPTGKPASVHTIDVWLVKDGKLAEVWHVEQQLQLMIQLGAMGAEQE
jgi:steroid delta-isomerase-like uncharacterized protein